MDIFRAGVYSEEVGHLKYVLRGVSCPASLPHLCILTVRKWIAFSTGHTFSIMKFSLATGLKAMEPNIKFSSFKVVPSPKIKKNKVLSLDIYHDYNLVNMTKSISIMA